jgi:lipid-A-disaccharide synthase
MMRQMLYLPYIGMPNILAGEKLVPELLQDEANPAALAGALVKLWRDQAARERQVEKFHEFHHLLRQNTAQKAADAVLEILENRR